LDGEVEVKKGEGFRAVGEKWHLFDSGRSFGGHVEDLRVVGNRGLIAEEKEEKEKVGAWSTSLSLNFTSCSTSHPTKHLASHGS
jgi:hypothetical protein